jgi:hypothetical protein
VSTSGRSFAFRASNKASCVFHPEGNTPFFSVSNKRHSAAKLKNDAYL